MSRLTHKSYLTHATSFSLTKVSVLPRVIARFLSSHSLFDTGVLHPVAFPFLSSTRTCISVTTCISSFASSLDECEAFVISMSTVLSFDRASLREPPIVAYCRGPALLLRFFDEKAPGRKRVMSGRRSGRHEHMIPTFVSTEDHVAAGGLSYVGSFELEMATSDWRRRMETMHTLLRSC